MSDIERIDQRLSAVERAVVDGDGELDQLADLAALAEDLERLESRVEEHERRIAELEGTVDAVSGFVGNVETVNEGVERQADAAIAAVDRLEYRIDELERALEKRGSLGDGRGDGTVTGERTGSNPPALEATGVDDRHGGTSRTAAIDTHNTNSTSTAGENAPFGRPGEVEETAGKLLGETGAGDADESAPSRLAVQQAIDRRLSDSEDASESNDGRGVTDDGASDEASTDENGKSTTLLASLRNRLP